MASASRRGQTLHKPSGARRDPKLRVGCIRLVRVQGSLSAHHRCRVDVLADGRTCQLQFWWRHKHEIQAGLNTCRPHDSHGGCRPRTMQSQGCSGEPVGQERSHRPPMGLQEAQRPVTCEKCSPERRLEWLEGSPLGGREHSVYLEKCLGLTSAPGENMEPPDGRGSHQIPMLKVPRLPGPGFLVVRPGGLTEVGCRGRTDWDGKRRED